jgi:N-acetyl-gamma-glutamyl-phosphate reductase
LTKEFKVFIDGSVGTTGLRIYERLAAREDIEILTIGEARRKDPEARLALMKQADAVFLCLPDAESAKVAEMLAADPDGENVRVLDASSRHRTLAGWTYGMPELTADARGAIRQSNRISVPGCHATGFILSARPLVDAGLLPAESLIGFHSLTGYSGGGKSMIAAYEDERRSPENAPRSTEAIVSSTGAARQAARSFAHDPLDAPRQYGLSQAHKHLPEMKKYAALANEPVFAPIVADFYSGMLVSVPVRGSFAKADVFNVLNDRYKDEPLVTVRALGDDPESGFLTANALSGRDDLEIFVTGNDERVCLIARYDNLGKGASGAAIQCMNIMLGVSETTGLIVG